MPSNSMSEYAAENILSQYEVLHYSTLVDQLSLARWHWGMVGKHVGEHFPIHASLCVFESKRRNEGKRLAHSTCRLHPLCQRPL